MARTSGTEDVLAAAAIWKERSLVGQTSVFSTEKLWTKAFLDELQTHFVENPRLGDESFVSKLQDQLRPASPSAHRLAGELLWVMFLFPAATNMAGATKRAAVREVWEWGGTELPENDELLQRALQFGVGSAGQAFHSLRWAELGFFIAFLRRWMELSLSDRERLAKGPWLFAHFLDATPGADHRQLRHMLLHLLFPDEFERISSTGNRSRIVASFADYLRQEPPILDPQDSPTLLIDRQFAAIRAVAGRKYPDVELDFYKPPLVDRWRPDVIEAGTAANNQPGMIGESLESILRGYAIARTEAFSGDHPIMAHFRNLEQALAANEEIRRRESLRIRWSAGRGNWAAIPWLAVLDTRETTTTQRGVYVVFLFREDLSGVYLTLNQGVTEPRRRLGRAGAREELRTKARELRMAGGFLTTRAFSLDDRVDLHAGGDLGAAYEDSTAAYKLYEQGNVPSDIEIMQDVTAVLRAYEIFLSRAPGGAMVIEETDTMEEPPDIETPPEEVTPELLRSAATEFLTAVSAASLTYSENFVRAFFASLVTKRFVILTGLSGSGKTQLALKFGEWVGTGHYLLVAVRPDWTGPESLLGYEDALLPTPKSGGRAWHVPPALEFLLAAAADPEAPYVLILDEMNLAHVERYFADVLSGMESDLPILPNLTVRDGLWIMGEETQRYLKFPHNVFVVGTVNVDETTYMFSPKVLDRANTLEFRVTTEALGVINARPIRCRPGPHEAVRATLGVATNSSWQLEYPDEDSAAFASHLKRLHELLTLGGLEFGHRVFQEAVRFHAVLSAVGENDWRVALDFQILQKILPRLSGSRQRLEPTLRRLLDFCASLNYSATGESPPTNTEANAPALEPLLPMSHQRVARLLTAVQINQFASFAE